MPHSFRPFTVGAALAAGLLMQATAIASAGDYWGALSIAPDGIWR